MKLEKSPQYILEVLAEEGQMKADKQGCCFPDDDDVLLVIYCSCLVLFHTIE